MLRAGFEPASRHFPFPGGAFRRTAVPTTLAAARECIA